MIREASKESLELASEFISRGELVAFPVEHGYALAGEPFIVSAVNKVHQIRKAEPGVALPLFIGFRQTLDGIANAIDPAIRELLIGAWPGALTLVVARSVPWDLGDGGLGPISVRQPLDPIALQLSQIHGPIAATAAAPVGQKSLSATEVVEHFGDLVPLIIDGGPRPEGPASTVLQCRGSRAAVVREGAVSLEEIKRLSPALQIVEVNALG